MSDVVIKNGKVKIPYGMDMRGLQAICDEAIATFRSKTEPNGFWMEPKKREAHCKAHSDAVFEAARKIYEEI